MTNACNLNPSNFFSIRAVWANLAEDPRVASRHLRIKKCSFLLPKQKKTLFEVVVLELALIEFAQIFLMSIWHQ